MPSVFARLVETQDKVGLSGQRLTFTGALTLPLLVESGTSWKEARASLELIVSEVADERAYQIVTEQLRARGFTPCDGSPTLWSDSDTLFELFVTPYERAGNFCHWHAPAIEARMTVERRISIVSAPYFLAIGLDRETSLGPLFQLVAGRSDLVEQLRSSPEAVRAFVSAKVRAHAFDVASLQADAQRAFPDDFRDQESYASRVVERVDAIARLVDECDPASVLSALLSSATPPPAPTPIPKGARTFPNSRTIRFAHYDAAQSVMTIGFAEDRVYRYFAVPKRVFDALCEAERPGRYLNEAIRNRFPFEQVDA